MDYDPLELLEQGGICRVLVFLLQYPNGISKSEYRRPPLNLGSRAINRDLVALYEAGFITVIPDPVNPIHTLTERGRIIAEKLREIHLLLQSNINEKQSKGFRK
jgi:DNA-binding HxlR family transcriptional regulator